MYQQQAFLPCIVHHIEATVLARVDTSPAAHAYRILATSLKPIEIAVTTA